MTHLAPGVGAAELLFDITPHRRWYYPSAGHRDVLGNVLYAIRENIPAMTVVGEPGTGKTTIWLETTARLRSDFVPVVFDQPPDTPQACWENIRQALRYDSPSVELDLPALADRLGHRALLLLIDNAHQADTELLATLVKSCFQQHNNRHPIQAVFFGQDALREKISTALRKAQIEGSLPRYVLSPLTRHESQLYIQHRLHEVGIVSDHLFDDAALNTIAKLSRGVPRSINLLCERSLARVRAGGEPQVTSAVVRYVVQTGPWGDGDLPPSMTWVDRLSAFPCSRVRAANVVIGVVTVALSAACGYWFYQAWPHAPSRPLVSATPAQPVAPVAFPITVVKPSPAPTVDAATDSWSPARAREYLAHATLSYPDTTIAPLAITDPARGTTTQTTRDGVAPTPPPMRRVEPARIGTPAAVPVYTIRVLLTQNHDQAQTLQTQLLQQDYAAYIYPWIASTGAWYGVLVGEYSDFALARRQALVLEQHPLITQASVVQNPTRIEMPETTQSAPTHWLPFR